jgi:hypothetical protein
MVEVKNFDFDKPLAYAHTRAIDDWLPPTQMQMLRGTPQYYPDVAQIRCNECDRVIYYPGFDFEEDGRSINVWFTEQKVFLHAGYLSPNRTIWQKMDDTVESLAIRAYVLDWRIGCAEGLARFFARGFPCPFYEYDLCWKCFLSIKREHPHSKIVSSKECWF